MNTLRLLVCITVCSITYPPPIIIITAIKHIDSQKSLDRRCNIKHTLVTLFVRSFNIRSLFIAQFKCCQIFFFNQILNLIPNIANKKSLHQQKCNLKLLVKSVNSRTETEKHYVNKDSESTMQAKQLQKACYL